MKKTIGLFFWAFMGLFSLAIWVTDTLAADDVVSPVVPDILSRVTLDGRELGGELDRRITDLIYKNYMVLDLDAHWLDYFRHREDRNGQEAIYYGIGKVIDAGSLFTAYTHDSAVANRTRYLIDELRKTRDADGYLGFWTVEPENRQNHINWILHEQEYITLALTRDYRMSGNPDSIADARIMGDYIMKSFPKDEKGVYHIPAGISIAGICEAFVELFRLTGEEKYWDYAQNLQYEPHWIYEPYTEWTEKIPNRPFHLYVMLSHLYPETERYRFNADETLLLKSRWMQQELLELRHGAMLITGSSSQGEHFTYNQNGAGMVEESCVTAYLLRLFDSLMRLDGDMRIGNVMERTIYNALFAAQEPCGRRICYFTPFSGKREFQTRDSFCCNGNFRRAVAEIPQKVFYRTNDDGIAMNLFTPVKKSFTVKGKTVEIAGETNYPTAGNVRLTFTTDAPVQFAFRFRTPYWCETMTATLNGQTPIEIEPSQQPLGFYEFDRLWKSGDVLELSMPMNWRLIRGRETQAGRFALMHGPILFGLGTLRNPNLPEDVSWSDFVLDPTSLGTPERDAAFRSAGLQVTAKMWTDSEQIGEPVEVIFTEFIDPSGNEVYFRIPDNATGIPVMDDEIFTQPKQTAEVEIIAACYGPEEEQLPIAEQFAHSGTTLADLAGDYVPSNGDQNRVAKFTDLSGTGSWSAWGLADRRQPFDEPGNATLLSSRFNVFGTPLGFAYGQENPDGLGFIANHTPSPNQTAEWANSFTVHALDHVIPPADRANWLFTHPLANPNSAVVVRWSPSDRYFENGILLDGTILSRASTDGVSLEIVAENEAGEKFCVANFLTCNSTSQTNGGEVTFCKNIPPGRYRQIDFLIGNNGTYMCDSTALKLRMIAPDKKSRQTDVTAEILTIFRNKNVTPLGDYTALFGDPTPGEKKSLKLKLKNRTTGTISYQQFPENTDLVL